MSTRLVFAFLLLSAVAAEAQPAVPAVPPAPRARAAATPAPAARPAPAATRAAPAADPDAPPTSDTGGVPARAATAAPPSADAAPTSDAPSAAPTRAQAASDAPPTSGAPSATTAQTASAAPNAAPATDVPAQPAVAPTVDKHYPLTAEGNARFLADYAARPDVKKLEDGVLYRVLRAAEPKAHGPVARGDTVTVSYRGWLIDGTVFDQTKPGAPLLFTLDGVIPGWRIALMKMKVGDLWEVAVPSEQAYGEDGRPGRIPPNQTLIFVVSLAKVEYAG